MRPGGTSPTATSPVKAGDAEGKNKVSQGETIDKDDTNTVITGESDKNTVTIDTSKGNVDVTFDDLKIDVSGKADGGWQR